MKRSEAKRDSNGYYEIEQVKPTAYDTVMLVDQDGKQGTGWWTGTRWHITTGKLKFLFKWKPYARIREKDGSSVFDPKPRKRR